MSFTVILQITLTFYLPPLAVNGRGISFLPLEAAITANTSFGKLTNGSKYYYSSTTAGAADIAVTVNSSAAHGSSTNPFVISSKEQWVGFAQVITGQNSGFTGNSKVWVLNADIDLAGNTIAPVGNHGSGFQGILYGNKHSIKNGTIAAANHYNDTASGSCGIFVKLNGGSVYDLIVENSLKFTMKTVAAGKWVYMGGIAAFSTGNVNIVNCHVKTDIESTQTAATTVWCYIGGIVGNPYGSGTTCIIKCSYNGTIYAKLAATSTRKNDDNNYIGGLVGRNTNAESLIIDQCSVAGTVSYENCGAGIGGVVGCSPFSGDTFTFQVTNVVVNVNVKVLGGANNSVVNTEDAGIIFGEDPWQDKGPSTSSNYSKVTLKVESIYILGGKLYRGTSDTTGNVILVGNENNCATETVNATTKNIVLPVAAGTAVLPSNFNAATSSHNKVTNTSGVVTQANKNSSITSNYTVSSSGAVTVKEAFKVSFVKGAGATGGPADTTYSLSSSVQNKTGTASPSRTGYSFKGWSLVSPTGALSNSTPTTYSIPANSRGNINVYAVWELKDFTGTPSAAAIVYGANATFTAAAVSCPAGTTDPNLGVGVGYHITVSDANFFYILNDIYHGPE